MSLEISPSEIRNDDLSIQSEDEAMHSKEWEELQESQIKQKEEHSDGKFFRQKTYLETEVHPSDIIGTDEQGALILHPNINKIKIRTVRE